jgi:hypothetical protein
MADDVSILSDETLLQICRASQEDLEAMPALGDELRLARLLIPPPRSRHDGRLEHAVTLLASAMGRMKQYNPTHLPFGFQGPTITSCGWIDRDDFELIAKQIVGLTWLNSNADDVACVVGHAISKAANLSLIEQKEYDAWRPGMLAHVITSKFCDHLPLNRQSGIFSRAGLDLPASTLGGWMGPWGAVTKSMQDHAAAATATDPNVQYAYEDGSGGADLDANFVRPDYVTYPGPSTRRVVYYNYPTSGVGAALGRLDNIALTGTSPSASQKYASYMYLGAGTMVDANYPAVTGIPALTYGSRADSYSGLDRFGRVVDQKWQNQSGRDGQGSIHIRLRPREQPAVSRGLAGRRQPRRQRQLLHVRRPGPADPEQLGHVGRQRGHHRSERRRQPGVESGPGGQPAWGPQGLVSVQVG